MAEIETAAALAQRQSELAALIARHADGGEGIRASAIPRLHLIRATTPSAPIHALHEPALCVVAQGRKQVMLGNETYQYDASHYLVVSVDLPIFGGVIEATEQSPYLCLRLDLDPAEIADVIVAAQLPPPATASANRGLFVSRTDTVLLDAVLRLVRLLDTPRDIAVLAPLAIREILYRILNAEQNDALRQIALIDSQAQRIAKVIEQIKRHYAQPLRIEALARAANMSPSSLHHHFKAVTAMTPLQYQKQLRLQQARLLMLAGSTDAATASHRVGYESPSQFSREYSRLFGAPPMKDVEQLRAAAQAG